MYALRLTRDAGPVTPRLAAWQVNHTLHVRNSDGASTPMTGPGAKVQVNVNPAGVVIEHYAFVPEVGWHPEREYDTSSDGWDRFVGTIQKEIREDLGREGFPDGARVRFGWTSAYLTCPPRMRQNHIPLVVRVSGVLAVPPQKKGEGLFRQPIEYHFPLVPNRAGFKKAFAEVIDLLDMLPDASLPWDQDLDALFP